MIKKLKKAFTITELVIVIAVIAILAAVLIPTFSNVIENANESAALQTSRNALTEYLAQVTGDEEPDNDNPVGMVFVSDDYAHVYLNGSLHLIGKTGSLAYLQYNGTDGFSKTGNQDSAITIDETLTGTKLNITLGVEEGTAKTDELIASNLTDMRLYIYSTTINEEKYYGCFALETVDTPKYQIEGATYSYYAGYSATSLSIQVEA